MTSICAGERICRVPGCSSSPLREAAIANDPAADRRAVLEGEEAIAKMSVAVNEAKHRVAAHVDSSRRARVMS